MKLTGLVVLLLASVAAAEEPTVFSDLGFEAACAKAKESSRIVMVDFFTTWCGPCKKLDKVTWHDEKVTAWLGEKVVALKIDAEKEEALAEKYHIRAYPTVLLLRADGTEIDRLVGYREPDQFLKDAADALAGRDSISRAKALLTGDDANNPMLRMDYADALAEKGKLEEALKEYLWCYDHGLEHSTSFHGVRCSFLLSNIARLGAEYPPALEALRTRRDAAAGRLLSGKGSVDDAGEVTSLNSHVGEAAKSLEVFDKLAKMDGTEKLRDAMFDEVFDALLEARRYGEIAPMAEEAMNDLFRSREEAVAKEEKEGKEQVDGYAEYLLEDVVKRGGGYYEALLGKGLDGADALAKRILKASPAGDTWAVLIEHAIRAGANNEARALSEAGLKATTGEDADAIREAAKAIPAK